MKKLLVLLAVVVCFAGCTKEETNFASKWKGTNYSLVFDNEGFCSVYFGSSTLTETYKYTKKGNTITLSCDFLFKRCGISVVGDFYNVSNTGVLTDDGSHLRFAAVDNSNNPIEYKYGNEKITYIEFTRVVE